MTTHDPANQGEYAGLGVPRSQDWPNFTYSLLFFFFVKWEDCDAKCPLMTQRRYRPTHLESRTWHVYQNILARQSRVPPRKASGKCVMFLLRQEEDVVRMWGRSVPPEPYKYKCYDNSEPQIFYITNNVYTPLQGVAVEKCIKIPGPSDVIYINYTYIYIYVWMYVYVDR